jgi:hypothetical protein
VAPIPVRSRRYAASPSTRSSPAPGVDASLDGATRDSGLRDGGTGDQDAGEHSGPEDAGVNGALLDAAPLDAALLDAATSDAEMLDSGPTLGAACAFNRDCALEQRCECSEAEGCVCAVGARGTGATGVDPCNSGNDCASSLCVEGDTTFYCSDECATDTDCGPMLPRCIDTAGIGRICVRAPAT